MASFEELENRLAKLEREMAALQARTPADPDDRKWFEKLPKIDPADSEAFRQAMAYGREVCNRLPDDVGD